MLNRTDLLTFHALVESALSDDEIDALCKTHNWDWDDYLEALEARSVLAQEALESFLDDVKNPSWSPDVVRRSFRPRFVSENDADCVGGQYELIHGGLFVSINPDDTSRIIIDHGMSCGDFPGYTTVYEPSGYPSEMNREAAIAYIRECVEADYAELTGE